MVAFSDRLIHAWNAFVRSPEKFTPSVGYAYGMKPDRRFLTRGNDRSIISALYNRIAIDVSMVDIRHCRIDKATRQYLETIDSGLNECLNISANVDQSGRAFIQDAVMTMFDDGVAALVPVDTNLNPQLTNSFDILSMRVGRVLEWYPRAVKLSVYNDREYSGQRQEIIMPKDKVAIVENPLYQIMNEPNSTLQRLIRKLNLLDNIDEQSSSGKLDLIVQLPYVIKTEERRRQAEKRRQDLEDQLASSQYGVAYTDGTEKVTQLNRTIENHMLAQVKYLTDQLYGQLGVSENLINGTATPQEILNYNNRTVEPIIKAICDALSRTFLTKTARTQGQTVMFFRDPFRLVPLTDLANIAAAFTSNEIMSSNEFRSILGYARSDEPNADQLRNANINPLGTNVTDTNQQSDQPTDDGDLSNTLDDQSSQLDDLESRLQSFQQSDQSVSALEHYASPYYDPVKAHEYYMRTRQLKGRQSTGGLNTQGKEALTQVKANLKAERDARLKKAKAKRDTTLEKSQSETEQKIAQNATKMQSEIQSLYAELDGLSGLNKASLARKIKEIQSKIASLRQENSKAKAELTAANRMTSQSARSEYASESKSARADYTSKVKSETAKITGESSFQKPKKTKKTRKGRSSRTGSSRSSKTSSSSKAQNKNQGTEYLRKLGFAV